MTDRKINPLAPDCEECNGEGKVWGGDTVARECVACDGTGKVQRDPVIEAKAKELTDKITDKARKARAHIEDNERQAIVQFMRDHIGAWDNEELFKAIISGEHTDEAYQPVEVESPREPGPSPDDLPPPKATAPDDCKRCGGTGRDGGYSARDDCLACRGTGKLRRVDVTATLAREGTGYESSGQRGRAVEQGDPTISTPFSSDGNPARCVHDASGVCDQCKALQRSDGTRPLVFQPSFVCPTCGPRVKADEDGCCAMCGADCAVITTHAPTKSEREQGVMKADVSMPRPYGGALDDPEVREQVKQVIYDRLTPDAVHAQISAPGANLDALLPKLDDRKVLDAVLQQYDRRGGNKDDAVQAWLMRLRDRLDALESLRESVATIDGDDKREVFMGDEQIKAALARFEDVTEGTPVPSFMPEEMRRGLVSHLREWRNVRARFYGELTRSNLVARRAYETCDRMRDQLDEHERELREERDAYKYSAAYWWAHYQRAANESVPEATDPEVRALVPSVQDAATWRGAVCDALGIEPDPEVHTPLWAFKIVRCHREIGNKNIDACVQAFRDSWREETQSDPPEPVVDEARERAKAFLNRQQDCGDCDSLTFRTLGAYCERHDVLLLNVHERNDGFDVERCPECSSNILQEKDKCNLIKTAEFIGYAGDLATKRNPGDMTVDELRRGITRSLHSDRITTTQELMDAIRSRGLTLIDIATDGDEPVFIEDCDDGVVVAVVKERDQERIDLCVEEISDLMPLTIKLVIKSATQGPYR